MALTDNITIGVLLLAFLVWFSWSACLVWLLIAESRLVRFIMAERDIAAYNKAVAPKLRAEKITSAEAQEKRNKDAASEAYDKAMASGEISDKDLKHVTVLDGVIS